jgi:hypothetical protein
MATRTFSPEQSFEEMPMPRPRSAMRKIRDVLRLSRSEGLSPRQVATSLGLSRITVRRYVERARLAGLSWPLPDGMDDRALAECLFAPVRPPSVTRPLPDFAAVHRELRRPGVTLQLLQLEYKESHPDGYEYSQFCNRYRLWQRHLDVVMRQEHHAGEKCFVDYAGQTVPISRRLAGRSRDRPGSARPVPDKVDERSRARFDELPHVALEHRVAHAEAVRSLVQASGIEVVAVAARQVARRSDGLGHDDEGITGGVLIGCGRCPVPIIPDRCHLAHVPSPYLLYVPKRSIHPRRAPFTTDVNGQFHRRRSQPCR